MQFSVVVSRECKRVAEDDAIKLVGASDDFSSATCV